MRRTLLPLGLVFGTALGMFAAAAAGAQPFDPLNAGPRGLTDIASRRAAAAQAAATAAAAASAPQTGATPTTMSPWGVVPPTMLMPGVVPQPAAGTLMQLPLPADPLLSGKPVVFGSQIFTGRFGSETYAGFNPDYQIAVGDRIAVRMWGAFTLDTVQPVDVRGNIFIPNVGPVAVRGIRNADLNRTLEEQVKRTFRSNVGLYATLDAAQPVKIYVTGYVRAPGLYAGLASDSVLYYLDRAGGVDPDRGSYLHIDVLRAGARHASVDLYRFLLEGKIDPMQLQDGDTVVVAPRAFSVRVSGEVSDPYVFEIDRPSVTAAELLRLARPRPTATHLSVVRNLGSERRSEYHPISDADKVRIDNGDEVSVTSDKYPGTLLVRIDGAHLGERTLVMPYGARLKDALARVRPAPQANMPGLQLYRASVADRQRELLENSLRSLETYALTARSATSEEASLRQKEGDQILQFIERARRAQPRGQVVLAQASGAGETLLEDGDVIRIPESSNIVLISGEVLMPNALIYDASADTEAYITRAGGYTQGADQARVLVLRQDGSVSETQRGARLVPQPGDQLMVLPKIQTKNIEVTRGITQIIYQIAVAARIALGL